MPLNPLRLLPLVLLIFALPCGAQEWTRFRGPNGSGVNAAITIPPVWTAKDYRWNITLPGGGHSSPVLWGDRIFITCADDQTALRTLLCISAADGSTIWKQEIPAHPFHQHGDNSYASSTPAVDADRVYVCWNTPEELSLMAFDHAGKSLWTTNLGPFISQHGGGNSPIVAGDVVLVGDDQEGRESFLFGIDRASGKILWKLPRRSSSFSASTPILFPSDASPATSPLAIFISKGEGITAVDPISGKVAWALSDVFDARTISSPVTADGLILATCGEGAGGHMLIAARPSDTASQPPQVAYKLTDDTPYVPTPLIKGDLLFLLSDRGILTCCRAATGSLIWQQRLGGSFYSSPVCANNTLFCTTKQGKVIAIAAAEKFQLLGQNDLSEKCQSTPALADGCMLIRTYTHLICVNGIK